MERFVCGSLSCSCWLCQPSLLPWIQWFCWCRNLGLFLHPLRSSWCPSSLVDTQHSHICSLISALQGPVSRKRHHFILPYSSHISICGERQLVCSWERAKQAHPLCSDSPALAATIPKCFPCSLALFMCSPFPKAQDCSPGLP